MIRHGHTPETLIAFEDRVAAAFEAKQVRGPIHLCSAGQAAPLLGIFEDVRPGDWKLGTWRGHWVALLSGVPEDEVFRAICDGRSMFLDFAKQRVLCSAIVGGIFPIAIGLAMGIKRAGGPERVWVFAGDMASRTGLYHEFFEYATGHALPICVVHEDNGLSTNADTRATWGRNRLPPTEYPYHYTRTRPHTGTGKHVTF